MQSEVWSRWWRRPLLSSPRGCLPGSGSNGTRCPVCAYMNTSWSEGFIMNKDGAVFNSTWLRGVKRTTSAEQMDLEHSWFSILTMRLEKFSFSPGLNPLTLSGEEAIKTICWINHDFVVKRPQPRRQYLNSILICNFHMILTSCVQGVTKRFCFQIFASVPKKTTFHQSDFCLFWVSLKYIM